MRTIRSSTLAAALLAAATAVPAAAQTQSWGLGLHTGFMNPGSLGEGEPNDMDLKLDDGWTGGGGIEWWLGSRRVGLRFDGAYTSKPYELESGEHEPTFVQNNSPGSGTTVTPLPDLGRVETWFGDASLMLRLLRPDVDRRFAPFVSLGAGFIRWDHEGDTGFTVGEADTFVQGDDQAEWSLTGALGADFFMTPNVALRVELKDYWNRESPYTFASNAEEKQEGAHHQIASFGLQFMFGGERVEEPGFIAAAPTPAPVVPAPAPAPPPAPATEQVTMCVVGEDGRLQTVTGTRTLDTGAITVTQSGRSVAFATAYPTVEPRYVRGASWYVASRPLIIGLDDAGTVIVDDVDEAELPAERIELVGFGSTQPISSRDLVYVGSIDGTPAYARASDLGDLRTDLDARLRISTDFDRVVADEAFGNRFLSEVETLYVAVEPGRDACVFQPLSSSRTVRSTRG